MIFKITPLLFIIFFIQILVYNIYLHLFCEQNMKIDRL
jgi:hypothetical protein